MKRRHLAAALLALSFTLPLLPGCGRDKGSATPQAAQELAELRMEQELGFASDGDSELQAELAILLSRFDKTADARLASEPHGITLLHLACVYKKTELARCLLLDGANPNARQLAEEPTADMMAENEGHAPLLQPADSPLTWATIPHREGATAEEMLPLINLLVENGADVNLPGPFDMPPLATATFIPSPAGEAVILHLLELGARCSEVSPPEAEGRTIPLSALVAAHGWVLALEKLLDSGATMATPTRSALHAAAENPAQPGVLPCAKLLLARGAQVDALNDEGATPLYIAAHSLTVPGALPQSLSWDAARAALEPGVAMIALLLEHGADPLRCSDADPEFPGSCAADFIAMNPAVPEMLAERGVTVPRRPIVFEAEGATFLAEVCRASLFGASAQEIEPHAGKILALLVSPSPEMQHSPLYADAYGHAVKLLARADASRTAAQVAQLPLWREQEAWQHAEPRTASLMLALLNTPELVLPREALLEHARRMNMWGVAEVTAVLVELLERDPGAEELIEALCADESLPVRAGALTARLLRAGLPAPRNGAVQEWLQDKGVQEAELSPALRRALLLTSLDKFWYGNMPADEVKTLLDTMRAIGAPKAAAFYAELAPNLSNPEALDRLTAPGGAADTARYELECATALFIWSQREEWLRLKAAAN